MPTTRRRATSQMYFYFSCLLVKNLSGTRPEDIEEMRVKRPCYRCGGDPMVLKDIQDAHENFKARPAGHPPLQPDTQPNGRSLCRRPCASAWNGTPPPRSNKGTAEDRADLLNAQPQGWNRWISSSPNLPRAEADSRGTKRYTLLHRAVDDPSTEQEKIDAQGSYTLGDDDEL